MAYTRHCSTFPSILALAIRPVSSPCSGCSSASRKTFTAASRWRVFLLLILQQLAAPALHEDVVDSPGVDLAWKANQLIRTQYHLALSTSTLAKTRHCNADYLGRVYRRVFCLTLTEALHRQRVLMAEKLLIGDKLPLTEVARQCGFNDVGYFRQIFRKHTGLTPASWKRRYCREHINS